MNDYVISAIRTYVPVVVASGLTWAANVLGAVEIETPTVSAAAVVFVTAVYYAVVRWVEKRWPAFGWLLGIKREVSYSK